MALWRLRIDGAANGAVNMAIDQALFERVQAGGRPVLRLYRWDPPCLSLGRNEPLGYDIARITAHGATLVRRPTGGLAVYHDRELTYTVVAPVTAVGRPRRAFERISRALVGALRALGVPAQQAVAGGGARGRIGVSQAGTCFAAPAPGEVVVEGRKVAGSAQRCEAATILQHGSLLLDGDQSIVSRFRAVPDPLLPASTTVREVLGRVPAWEELCDVVRAAFAAEFEATFECDEFGVHEPARVAELVAHYESAAWTARR